jgi:hypothetical protein
MKNIFIFIISLALLVGFGIWEINYFNDSSMYILSDIDYAKGLVESDKFTEASNHIKEIDNTWNNMKNTWNIFVNHDEIDDIEENLTNYKMYIRLGDKDEVLVYAEQLHKDFSHISKKQKLYFENVF